MRPFALLGTAAAVLVGFASCANGGRPPVEACAGAPGTSSGMATAARSEPLVGILRPPNEGTILARFDPLSLEPVSRKVQVGEYHDAWSVSPDGSQLALGVSAPGRTGRIGILIVDLEAMKVVREIETGIAAEALGWLAPRLLVAGLIGEGTVLVDPRTGTILRRWADLSFPDPSARTRDALVMLFPGPLRATAEGEGAAAPVWRSSTRWAASGASL